MEWVDDLAVDLGWSRSQVMYTLLGLVRAAGVVVVDAGDVAGADDIVNGVVVPAGSEGPVDGAGLAGVAADAGKSAPAAGGLLVTGDEVDDHQFSEGRRRRMIDELYEMAMGNRRVNDTARVRAAEQWTKLGSEHWELRSRADDDDVVGELLNRMTAGEIADLLDQARELAA